MALSKRNDPRRKWRAFKRHARLVLWTVLCATFATAGWYEVWTHGYHLAEDDKDIIIGAIVTTLGLTYGILYSWVLGVTWEKYRKTVIAVLEKDKHTFLLYRDERMPILFHLLIGSVSLPLWGMIGVIAYKHVLTGAMSVFAISIVLVLFWRIAVELENPSKGGWFLERIDPEWLTVDVDEYFELGGKYKGRTPAPVRARHE
jgi:hypothetical protein